MARMKTDDARAAAIVRIEQAIAQCKTQTGEDKGKEHGEHKGRHTSALLDHGRRGGDDDDQGEDRGHHKRFSAKSFTACVRHAR